jgi:hypothetical protein
MRGDPITVWLVFLPFLFFASWVLVKAVVGVSRFGLSCRRAFAIAWVLAYALPVVLLWLEPRRVTSEFTIAWMTDDDWFVSIAMALVGYMVFGMGYWGRRVRNTSRNCSLSSEEVTLKGTETKETKTRGSTTPTLILLIACALLQLCPLYIVVSQRIEIEFAHRQLHWAKIGNALYLLYFCLPAVAVAVFYFLGRPSKSRAFLLLLSLVVSTASAVVLGQRMFLVLILLVSFLVYSAKRPIRGLFLYGVVFAGALSLAVGFKFLFRESTQGDLPASFYAIPLGDLARNQFLSYVVHYMGFWRSDIVSPPILPSYLYWLILPIPRAMWAAKPYVAPLQFNQHLGYSLGIADLARPLEELFSGNAFGLIEEALMNLGFMGFMLVAIWGFIAARIDWTRRYPLSAKVTFPVFYLVATFYPFNATLMITVLLFIVLFMLDKINASSQDKACTCLAATDCRLRHVSR